MLVCRLISSSHHLLSHGVMSYLGNVREVSLRQVLCQESEVGGGSSGSSRICSRVAVLHSLPAGNRFAAIVVKGAFEAIVASTSSWRKSPVSVSFAYEFGRSIFNGRWVWNTSSVYGDEAREFLTCWSLREDCESTHYSRTDNVVNLDRDQRQTSSLISECKVNSSLGHWNTSDFGVYDNLRVTCESSFIRSDAIDQLERLNFGCFHDWEGRVELIGSNWVVVFMVVKGEGFLAGQSHAWKEITVPHAKLDFDVEPLDRVIRFLDERSPQPVVDIVVGDVTDYIGPPMNALFKVCEGLFHPTWGLRVWSKGILAPVEGVFLCCVQ